MQITCCNRLAFSKFAQSFDELGWISVPLPLALGNLRSLMTKAFANRKDIDGLRSVAVIPVVLYHLDLSLFGGGFVGVDIFFVISGFLITRIIAREIAEFRFSIVQFYNRRVRRILPALFAMVTVTSVFAFLVLPPPQIAEYGKSVAAVAAMAANIFYWNSSGYFDVAAETKPLLHTWSLGVEEQFYVFFPIVLRLASRWRGSWGALAWCGLLASLVLSIVAVRFYPDATFYLLPTRAWELLAGSVIALGAVPKIRSRILLEGLSLLGLGSIIYAVILYSDQTRFPGETALLPVLGAALIIATGEQGKSTSVTRILSFSPLVFLGLLSYSLYLWHWPVIVFSRLFLEQDFSLAQAGGILAVSLALSYLSWRYVEQPFRARPSKTAEAKIRTRPVIIGGLLSVLVLVAGISISFLFSSQDLVERVYGTHIATLTKLAEKTSSPKECMAKTGDIAKTAKCLLGDSRVAPSIALLGDSMADALHQSVGEMLARNGKSAVRYIFLSCPPILGVSRNEPARLGSGFAKKCSKFVENAVDDMISDPAIEFVLLHGAYDGYFRPKSDGADLPLLIAGKAETDRSDLISAAVGTAEQLAAAGKTVILIGPTPIGYKKLGAAAILEDAVRAWRSPEPSIVSFDACIEPLADIGDAFERAQSENIVYLDASKFFLKNTEGGPVCDLVKDGLPLTSDGSHVTRIVADLIAEELSGLLSE